MPPNIPGARRGVRPSKGSRKTNARAHKFSSKRASKRGASDDSRPRPRGGFGLLALVSAGVAALVGFVLHQAAEYERENERVRARLRGKPRVTSEHAACRMECRFITAEEVERTLVDGKVDARHSTPNARPCPKVALNMGRVRVVWADCADSTRLVTAIDAETNHPCGPC